MARKRIPLLCLATMMISISSSQGNAIPVKDAPLHEGLVLADRLVQIHNRQIDLAKKCESRIPAVTASIRKSTPKYLRPIRGGELEKDAKALERTNLSLIGIVQTQYQTVRPCLDPKAGSMAISPRKSINSVLINGFLELGCTQSKQPLRCMREVGRMTSRVRPYCFKAERSGSGVYEDYACLAGDRLMDESLRPVYAEDRYGLLLAYSAILLQKVMETEVGGAIDLYQVHKNAMTETTPESFLATWAAVGSSGNSGLVGYLQGLEDRWLIEDLAKGLAPKVVRERYHQLQQAKLFYQLARNYASERKIRLSVGLKDVTEWNRHNVMASYLGCALAKDSDPEFVRIYVSTIGAGYESRDFISHLSRGTSLKSSNKNFEEDTRRYRSSVSLGLSWCGHRS